ncbi:MAG: hypothetical protein EOO40_12530 [Deltaproteobacteria bacterium]|nr:MAG: hypothetical protein EOO40_12530 [Deltaproteobacteria bacterium]
MMQPLGELLGELERCDRARELDGLKAVRERILAAHPDSEAASEALYKLGLDALFRARDLERAVLIFEQAAGRKHAFWSAAARTSLGLCYFHLHRSQKALFELRKVAYAKTPSVHSVTALAFIENIFATQGNGDEATRVRKERITQLEQLIVRSREARSEPSERGHFLYQLAMALRDHNELERAKVSLEEARALGPEGLGTDLFRAVVDAL